MQIGARYIWRRMQKPLPAPCATGTRINPVPLLSSSSRSDLYFSPTRLIEPSHLSSLARPLFTATNVNFYHREDKQKRSFAWRRFYLLIRRFAIISGPKCLRCLFFWYIFINFTTFTIITTSLLVQSRRKSEKKLASLTSKWRKRNTTTWPTCQ